MATALQGGPEWWTREQGSSCRRPSGSSCRRSTCAPAGSSWQCTLDGTQRAVSQPLPPALLARLPAPSPQVYPAGCPHCRLTPPAVPKFILLAARGAKLPVHRSGGGARAYLFVDDVVQAFDLILHGVGPWAVLSSWPGLAPSCQHDGPVLVGCSAAV